MQPSGFGKIPLYFEVAPTASDCISSLQDEARRIRRDEQELEGTNSDQWN